MPDLKYCSNIVIGNKYQNLWQNIYGSQSYGTFYSVFSKFDIANVTDSSCDVDLIHLKMINYKGLLNMAFYKNDDIGDQYSKGYKIRKVPYDSKNPLTEHEDFILLQLFVCAKAGNPKSRYELQIAKEDLDEINFCDGQLMFIERVTLSFDGKSEDFLSEICNNEVDTYYEAVMKNRGVFDNEFFYRNGFIRKKRQDTDASLIKGKQNAPAGLLEPQLLDGNPSCHNSALYFRFKQN